LFVFFFCVLSLLLLLLGSLGLFQTSTAQKKSDNPPSCQPCPRTFFPFAVLLSPFFGFCIAISQSWYRALETPGIFPCC
jgi:hypothetical protein